MRTATRIRARWRPIWVTAVFLLLTAPLPAFAQTPSVGVLAGTATEFVKVTIEQLLSRLGSEREAIKRDPTRSFAIVNEVIIPRVDVELVARLVLGKHWRSATTAEREAFVGEFQILLARTYAAALTDQNRANITYLGETRSRSGRYTLVRTHVAQANGGRLAVAYRLANSSAGLRFVDTVVEGVSLIATYRNTFSAQIKDAGMASLLARLREKSAAQNADALAVKTAATH